ncbi:yjeF C-terminal region, hydroxyethylthiazole kinase-related/yjeF N-terminal region [Cribrihabitans marinus]|uniref:Bifunctional NAD(P)H-hydrate repair enzyme n=1 Tax=Cribrihabitans marinus TaxID=1227549 RepID=A0A1H6VIK4_9RHOB|nr:NAD(P)H-hydrate dehydratase [Cribrihabitans marinus]GGH26250.1 bifunctional NAD(P)H-hydrate repair enzyme [Cribrihabitans marinus]SEJ00055.1 yjeF C-terminal region, hydroxyethylthiazole kinase-related/yjeF N-terminal region [Cribrihabitans marinus]
MTEVLSAAQMRAIEGAAIASGEVSGLQLMEQAGSGVVEAVLAAWPGLDRGRGPAPTPPGYFQQEEADAPRVLVLCGPGNNGGDGFVVARLLARRGWRVALFLFGNPQRLPPDARANCDRWAEIGPIGDLSAPDALAEIPAPDLIVDGLFGTGLVRPVEGGLAQVVRSLADLKVRAGGRVVAIDIPSGLCADSGRALGELVTADLTVSFHRAKRGHYLDEGPERCGRVVVCPIGLDPKWDAQAEGPLVRIAAPEVLRLGKTAAGHKYSQGHALVLTGGAGKTGAARLAARAALRVGAGLVTLGVPPAAQMEVASQISALMLRRVDGPDGLDAALQDARVNAICLGPGLGLERARELVPTALRVPAEEPGPLVGDPGSGPARAVVLDADALTTHAEAPEDLFALLHGGCVLTPHGGEFARLFPDIAERLRRPAPRGPAYSKVDATTAAAARAGCVVLLKGPDTVIAAPDGRCSIHSAQYDRAAPWLATAGSGDVLAGLVTGLLARGFDPFRAAETGAWLHVQSALRFGPGLIAEDLPEQLPGVFRDLGVQAATG